MLRLGFSEITIIILIIILLLYGPKKLPELARSIGLARKEFKKAMEDESNQ